MHIAAPNILTYPDAASLPAMAIALTGIDCWEVEEVNQQLCKCNTCHCICNPITYCTPTTVHPSTFSRFFAKPAYAFLLSNAFSSLVKMDGLMQPISAFELTDKHNKW